jgi:hypothetical protein
MTTGLGATPIKAIADTVSTPGPLIGLRVILPNTCACGATHEATIGLGAELHCVACSTSRQWLGPRARAFLTEIVNRFGSPVEPIVIRRALGQIEAPELIIQPSNNGRLVEGWLANRRQLSRSGGGST